MNTAPADESLGRLGRGRLLTLLATIGQQTGFDVHDAELIKFTNNAVFRLPHAGVVARIAGSRAVRHRIAKVVTVARWLAAHDLPAVRLLPDLPQPLAVDGEAVTLWYEVPRVGPQPTGTELGGILRRIHALASPDDLPAWNPLAGIRARLADAEELAEDDHVFLLAVCDELEAAVAAVEFALPPALVHGDATVANLIPGPHGPAICDFDSTSYGPAEWDLTPVAVGYLRFGNATNNQALLTANYGFDITTWPGFPVFRRLRELQLVTSVVPVLRSNPGLRAQWRHRLETFRNGDLRARWELYR
jgi:hypothetical protein